MSNLSTTAANVLASSARVPQTGTAGATILAGQWLYKDAADGDKLKLADANGSAATAAVAGVALHGAYAGNPVLYTAFDPVFTPGGTMTVGQRYFLSATPGAACPSADLTTADIPVFLFIAITTTTAVLNVTAGTAAIP